MGNESLIGCAVGVCFDKPGVENTESVFRVVTDYIEETLKYTLVVSSTTGYTAKIAEKYLKDNEELIICKQDISEKFSMRSDILNELEEKYTVVDIPKKYLNGKIGATGTNLLRKISQGVKVCFELIEYLIENEILTENTRIIVIAGTLHGADTAVAFRMKGKENYLVERIICLPQNKIT